MIAEVWKQGNVSVNETIWEGEWTAPNLPAVGHHLRGPFFKNEAYVVMEVIWYFSQPEFPRHRWDVKTKVLIKVRPVRRFLLWVW